MNLGSRASAPWALALWLASWSPAATPATGEDPAYVTRGRQIEALQRSLHDRLDRFHRSLCDALDRAAPDLRATLEPPPQNVHGYQVLPRIVPDAAPPPPGSKSEVVSFGWSWSETLIDREMAALDRLETDLATLSAADLAPARSALAVIISEYKAATDRRRTIDGDIDYNWLWQAHIARDRALFDRLQETQGKVLARDAIAVALASSDDDLLRAAAAAAGLDQTSTGAALRAAMRERVQSLSREIAATKDWVAPPDFVRVERPAPGKWVVTVPFYTDIQDGDFVEEFRRGVESAWHVSRSGTQETEELSVRLAIETVSPEWLYCGDSDEYAVALSPGFCQPPVNGTHLDLEAHVAHFPPDSAVLTTGATTLRWIGDRGIALGPRDVSARVLAHEVGHVIGFPDAYFRGYRDLGADGFQVTELVDLGDIMGAPGVGPVLPRHFETLIATKAKGSLNRSLELFRQRRFSEAAVAASEAIRLRPGYAEAFNNLAAAYAGLGRWDEAIVAANEALRLKPAFQLARNNLEWARGGKAKGQGGPPG